MKFSSLQSIRMTAAALILGLLAGCGEPANHARSVVILLDISNDYASEMEKARTLTNYLLGDLTSGDSITIAFIDNRSFTERNIITRAEFDHRPSVTTQQKRIVRAELDAFFDRFRVPSHHSDITGGVLLARDVLRESHAGRKYVFLVSDLREDLMPGLNRNVPLELDGIEVIGINVVRQVRDNYDPLAYQRRVDQWQKRIEENGGSWRVANDLARLEQMAVLR
jgi:hypothetical protein